MLISPETKNYSRETIEERRHELLNRLESLPPFSIFNALEQSQKAAFIISDKAAKNIRHALKNPACIHNESAGLAKAKIAARTSDDSGYVYSIESFYFETVGTADGVISIERDTLNEGEIEVHSHVASRPDYLGKTDVGDLIAAVEGPAWNSPRPQLFDTAWRIFGILSIYHTGLARLNFYCHDLRDELSKENNFGLKRLGMPISLPNAF